MTEFSMASSASTPWQLFEGKLYRIPDYQRGYAWEKPQLDDFLEDLELLPADRGRHYTGTVVLHRRNDDLVRDKRGSSYEVFDVVDGQQRLTTIVVLLDAVRRELAGLGQDDLAQGIMDRFVAVIDRNDQPLPKLKLNSDCQAFFFDSILSDGPAFGEAPIRSHRNLSNAKKHFLSFLQEKGKSLGSGYPLWLEELRHKICDQLVISLHEIQEDADAGVIFEVMNNRGKPITEFEKAKNYLLYLSSKLELEAKTDLPLQVNKTWTYVFERLMASYLGASENEDQLLRIHWVVTQDPWEWAGSKSIKDCFHLRIYMDRHTDLLKALFDYVQTLRQAASAYCDVAKPQVANSFSDLTDETTRGRAVLASQRLVRLRVVAPFLPLLVSIRMKCPSDGELYIKAANLCEKYAFRVYRLLRRRADAGRASLYSLAHHFYKGEIGADEMLAKIAGLARHYSSEEDIAQFYAIKSENDYYNWTGIRYFLYEYETSLAEGENKNVYMDWELLDRPSAKEHTIEHILPQTPEDDYWLERWTDDERSRYTHDLGNLCLTTDNSSYSNKPFDQKRGEAGASYRCYARGDLVMERDLARYDDWSLDSLRERRERMVMWAKSRWGLPVDLPASFEGTAASDEIDDRTSDDPVQDDE